MSIVNELRNLPGSCTYALYNPNKHKVYLGICKDALKSIPLLIHELREGHHSNGELTNDLQDLELIILEECDYSSLRLHLKYWYDYTKNLGMKYYRKHPILRYKSRINIGKNYEGDDVILVELVNRRNEATVVGLFDNRTEADEFVDTYFTRQKYIYPVYATNKLTRDYIIRENEQISNTFNIRL